MNRLLLSMQWWLCAFFLVTQSLHLSANPNAAPETCPSVNGHVVSCVNQLETYMTAPVAGYSYAWSVSSGGTLSTATGPSTLVNWHTSGAQFVVLISTDPSNVVTNCTLNVTVNPRPTPTILTDFISDCPEKKGEQNAASNGEKRDECWVVCENSVVNYWTTTVPGNTYSWVIVGGTPTTATGSSVAVTWGAVGSGTVILTETAPGGCSETVEQCIKIVEAPKAIFLFNGQDPNAGPLKICLGETVYFADQSIGAAYWLWDFGDGVTSTLQNPYHPYNTPGTYNGTLTVKNECGCTNVLPFQIIVSDQVSPDIGCISTVCLKDCAFYSVSNLGNCPGANVTWTVHGGAVLNQPGSTSINVVWDDNDGFIQANGYGMLCVSVTGCPDLCDNEVCVRVPVIHEVKINGDQIVCAGDVITYSVPVQPGINEPGFTPDGVDFDWYVSPGGTIVSGSPYSNTIGVVWNYPGTYTVDLDAYENYLTRGDCKFDPAPITVTVLPSFTINPGYTTICPSTTQAYTLSGSGLFNWSVAGPSGTITLTTGPSYTVTPTLPGIYTISAVSATGTYCNTATAILKVLPSPPTPTGTVSGNLNVCPNTPYTYTLSNTPPPGTVYVWSITGGTLYGGAGQTVTAQWSGIPPMILTVKTKITSDPFCLSAPLNFTINNYVPPTTFVTGPGTACVNETKSYSATGLSNYTNLHWTVSPAYAGSVVSGQGTANISVLFNTSSPAVAQVICTATVCGSAIVDTKNVTVTQIPTYTISTVTPPCQNDPVTLSLVSSTGVSSFNWNFGDGYTGTGPSPSHAWSGAGSYPVTATLNLNICGNPTVTAATTVTVKPVPIAFVTASNGYAICGSVTSTTLTAAAQSACSYQWVGGPTGATWTVTSPGTYTVIATDLSSGCTSTVQTIILSCNNCTNTCNPANPAWTFTAAEACDVFTFTPTPTGATFNSWNFGDNTGSSTAGTVSHTYAHPGYYHVVLTSVDPVNGCVMKYVQTIIVKFKGNFSVNYSCASGSMQTILTDLSEYFPGYGASPTWYDGVPSIGTGSILTTTLSPGAHAIKFSSLIGAQTCYSPVQNIAVPGMPVAAFTNNSPKCEGVPVQFTNTSSGSYIGYSWAFGDGATSGVVSPQRVYDAPPVTYTATLTLASSWGCTSTASSTVNITNSGTAPSLTVAPATTVCEGSPITITATSGYTYSWFNGAAAGVPLSTANPFSPTLSGTYGVNAVDANGCPYNVMAPPVVFLPPPYVQIVGKTDYCPGETIALSAEVDGCTYAWTSSTPAGSFTWSTPNISQLASIPGTYTYTVVITHTASGCTNSGTLSVVVHPGISSLSISSSANCEPATLTATATASGPVTFNWSTGATSSSILVPQSGFYSVIATDDWGCTAQQTYNLEGRPDLSNVMTGCYEYCEKVVWQAINCGGCSYQWYLNGTALPGETNPTITIATSGSYTVVVSNGPGCDTESDPIDISIASSPDLCHKCNVETLEGQFECVGIDPGTGFPIYSFAIDVLNNGGALYGVTVSSTFGGAVIDSPVGGYIPGGGAVTTISGHLIWDGSTQNGCFYFTGFLTEDCQVIDKCEFKWCGELPKCCDRECSLKLKEPKVTCIANGFYQVTVDVINDGCTLFNLFVKTELGLYPISPSSLPGGTTTTISFVIPAYPGSFGITICGYRFNGERCCVDYKLEVPPCEDPGCKLDIKNNGIVCLGKNAAGHYVYHFDFDIYGAPAGAAFAGYTNASGVVSALSISCAPGVCNVQGTFESYGQYDVVCVTVVATGPGTPPQICWGKICFDVPPCKEAKGTGDRNSANNGKPVNVNTTGFMLAPNPAYNEVAVYPVDQSVKAAQVVVTDMMGQNKLEVKPVNDNIVLNISHLPAGIYNVIITDVKGNVSSKKLVVIR